MNDEVSLKCEVYNILYRVSREGHDPILGTSEVMQLFERDGERARSSEWLARREAEEKGHGRERTEAKRGSDVGPHKCPHPECEDGMIWDDGNEFWLDCPVCSDTAKRSEERAKRRANVKTEESE